MPALFLFRQSTLPALLAAAWAILWPAIAAAQLRDTIPTQAYYAGINQLYRGDYHDAERIFRRELRGAIKTVQARWIDSICYHAMLGEVYYHQGRLALALEQFDHACTMFLQYPKWMLRVKFEQAPRPDASLARQPIPWGVSGRQFTLGRFSSQMLIAQGDLNSANRAAQQGGVVVQPQYWRVNVIEIVRCTALAIRRRNELLGPLAAHDSLSKQMLTALSRGGAPPNHWSNAWIDLELGMAQAGVGETKPALQHLQRAERIAGQFDHPLTGMALLEQGRLAMEAGNTAAAGNLFAEASYSAFYYDDLGTMDDAFRWGAINRLAGTTEGVNPAWKPAAAWARRKRLDHLFARLSFAMTEDLMAASNWKSAAATLQAGQSQLRDARTGLLGNWSLYLQARVLYQQGRDSAPATLRQAVQQRIGMSPRNLQIQLANQMFDQQQLKARSAVDVYRRLLDDPTPADWVFRPLETLAVMKTPHDAAFDRWLDALILRKDKSTALEVTDRAKRRRFHGALAWGGRLAALRHVLEAPDNRLSQHAQNQHNELLLKYPEYEQLRKTGRQLRAELQTQWRAGLDDQQQSNLVQLWKKWSSNLDQREAMLGRMGLERVAADLEFPPLETTADLQSHLQPGQAVVVFHNTPGGLLGFLVTDKAQTQWNCGPMGRLSGPLSKFLRSLGNYDANRQLTAQEMESTDWLKTGAKLFQALFHGSSIDPEAIEELILVPDGIVWYVPMAALPIKTEDRMVPLIAITRMRTVPTVGLAFGGVVPWRRIQRSAVVGNEIAPGKTDEQRDEALTSLRAALIHPIELPSPAPVSSSILASLLDTLVVLDDIDVDWAQPLAWSPLPLGRPSPQNSLEHWLALPELGPQRVILPGMHTLAERGGKVPKRRSSSAAPGSELFLSSCALLSSGAQTILMSRWRVGGQSTLELVREFVQELPHTTAADAWQRSVQLALELPIDPASEPRVKASKEDQPWTASHPFFWGGYLLVDAGAPGEQSDRAEGSVNAQP